MTTTSSTTSSTSTASTATTTSASTAANSATASILTSLGAGSGIDTQSLINNLANAEKAPKEAAIEAREAANQASVSSLAQIANGIDTFASALSSLISGGTLFSQPSVSDDSVVSATAQAGSNLGGLSSQLVVEQLAQAQSLVSTGLNSATDAVGTGTLTLTVGTTSYDITVDSSNNTLAGLAKAINDKNTGVTATVITDQGKAKLVLRGATGTDNAFSLSVPDGTSSGLERFAYDSASNTGAMTRAQEAKNAIVDLDGVQVQRSSNTISDLISGVTLTLKKAAPTETISMGVTRPTAAITQAVNDFVSAYNELKSMLDDATKAPSTPGGDDGGPLRGDVSVRQLQTQLAGLTSKVLNSGGGPSTLAEIGVATNRDGTLSVRADQLQSALDKDPDGVERMFNPGQYSSSPYLTIGSAIGKVKPGTYTITNVTPGSSTVNATGMVNGLAMLGSATGLVAPSTSDALGLILKVSGPVASATITIDSGLGGALQGIRDALRATGGPLASTQKRLADQADTIAQDRDTMETRYTAYYDQLVASFTRMDSQVSAYKATQSYMQQQIDMWSKGS